MRRHMKVHSEGTGGSGEVVGSSGGGGDGGSSGVDGGPGSVRAESIKEEDGTSETSATSPGQHLPIRPRQGSRSSI